MMFTVTSQTIIDFPSGQQMAQRQVVLYYKPILIFSGVFVFSLFWGTKLC